MLRCSSVALLLLSSGCLAESRLFEGPAVWAVALSGVTEVGGLFTLKTGVAAVVVADVKRDRDVEESWVSDATVAVSPAAGRSVDVEPIDVDGLYLSTSEQAVSLFSGAGSTVRATAAFDGESHWIEAPSVDPAVSAGLSTHTPGTRLVVDLPKNLGREHDAVLTQVFDASGAVIWDDFPDSARGWVDLLDGGRVPDRVVIPRSVLVEPGTDYAVAVYAIRQDDDTTRRSPSLSSNLSGIATGSALLDFVRTTR